MYTCRFNDITIGMPRKIRYTDNTILWEDSKETSFGKERIHWILDNRGQDKTYEEKDRGDIELPYTQKHNKRQILIWAGESSVICILSCQNSGSFWELIKTKDWKFYWESTLYHIFKESKQRIVQEIENGVKTFKVNRFQ